MTQALIAAQPPTDPPPDGPPGQPYISPDDLASIGPLWNEAVREHLMPVVAEMWDVSSDTIYAEMVDVTGVELPPLSSLTAEEYLAAAANTFKEVGDDLWETARAEMLAGFQAGESIDQIAERLRASAGLTAKTAVLVARTQILDASNAASIATVRAAGLDMTKGWLDTPDKRTRPTHHAAGETYGETGMIGLEDKFVVGGFDCDRPHDPTLPTAERYNCRCTLSYGLPDEAIEETRVQATPEPPLPNTSGVAEAPAPVEAVAEAPTVDRAARRAAARARQKTIDQAEPVAAFAAEIDNVAYARQGMPFDDEARTIFRQRLRRAEVAGIPAEDLSVIEAAVEAGDLARLRGQVRRLTDQSELTPIGAAGESLPFDPELMRAVSENLDLADGEQVQVIRQGFILTVKGEQVRLDPAVVTRRDRSIIAAAQMHTGAMIAAIPTVDDAQKLAVQDGELVEQLHMTGLYLGEATDWTSEEQQVLTDTARAFAATVEPFTADGFALALFNPANPDRETCVVLGLSGDAVADFHDSLTMAFEPFAAHMPDQHRPNVAHLTLEYTDDPNRVADLLDRCGPVEFDRLRVAFGGSNIDIPLGGGDNQPMATTAAQQPPIVVSPADDMLPDIEVGTPWEGVLAPEGIWSGDGRQFAPDALTWAPLPLALKWQPEEDDGHDGAVIVGRIDTINRVGNLIHATGVMDDEGIYGAEALRLMRKRMLRGVSIRGDDSYEDDIELVYPAPPLGMDMMPMAAMAPMASGAAPMEMPMAGYAIQVPDEPEDEDMPPMPMETPEPAGEPKVIVHRGRIRSATLVPEQAFVEAEIMLIEPMEPTLVAAAIGPHKTPTSDAPWDGPAAEAALPSPMPVDTARAFYAWIDDAAILDGEIPKSGGRFGHHDVAGGSPGTANVKACQSGIGVLNGGRGGTTIPGSDVQGVYDHVAKHLRDAGLEPPPLTASTGPGPTVVVAASYTVTIPEIWPEEWFQEPAEQPPIGALHITAQGRVFGYLGPDHVTHRAFRASGRSVTIPRGVDYSEFQNKPALVAGMDGEVYRINAGNITFDCGHPSPYDTRRVNPNWAMQHYDNTCSVAARIRVGENRHGTWAAGGLLHGITPDAFERMMACALSGDWQDGKLNAALLVPVEGFPVGQTSSVRIRDDAIVASSVPIRFVADRLPVDTRPLLERLARSIGRDTRTRFAALRARRGGD